jgi:DHA1 family multidrug resistance protein-like MFS transporter
MLFISSFVLFAEKQVEVTAQEVVFLMAWIGILRVIFQSALINPLQNKFGENSLLNVGIISMVFTMIILVFTTNYILAYVSLTFLAFGTGVCRPIFMSKLTKSVIREETGSVLGVSNALSSIGQIITPILGGALIQYFPALFLPGLSAIIFIVLLIQWIKVLKK